MRFSVAPIVHNIPRSIILSVINGDMPFPVFADWLETECDPPDLEMAELFRSNGKMLHPGRAQKEKRFQRNRTEIIGSLKGRWDKKKSVETLKEWLKTAYLYTFPDGTLLFQQDQEALKLRP